MYFGQPILSETVWVMLSQCYWLASIIRNIYHMYVLASPIQYGKTWVTALEALLLLFVQCISWTQICFLHQSIHQLCVHVTAIGNEIFVLVKSIILSDGAVTGHDTKKHNESFSLLYSCPRKLMSSEQHRLIFSTQHF